MDTLPHEIVYEREVKWEEGKLRTIDHGDRGGRGELLLCIIIHMLVLAYTQCNYSGNQDTTVIISSSIAAGLCVILLGLIAIMITVVILRRRKLKRRNRGNNYYTFQHSCNLIHMQYNQRLLEKIMVAMIIFRDHYSLMHDHDYTPLD